MWEHVADAVAYLMPGFVAYILCYKPLTGARGEGDLFVSVKSVIWSLPISCVASEYAVRHGYQVDWQSPQTMFWLLLMAVSSGLAAGSLERHFGVSQIWWHLFGRSTTKYPTVWQEAFDFRRCDGRVVFVRLSDGGTYYGALTTVTEIPSDDSAELLLEDTYYFPPLIASAGPAPDWVYIGRPVYISTAAVVAVELGMTGEEIARQDLGGIL